MTKAERLHLDRVAALGCLICRHLGYDTPPEIHHVRTGQGMGQRANPFATIPLCPRHHRHGRRGEAIHAGRESWERNFGTELTLLNEVEKLLKAQSRLRVSVGAPGGWRDDELTVEVPESRKEGQLLPVPASVERRACAKREF